jgi:hypothetical protein
MRTSRKTKYKTLKGLLNAIGYPDYISGEAMANKRARFADGWWYNFRVTDEVENEFWSGMAHVVWKNPSKFQIRNLRYAKSWMLQRMMWKKHGFSYCAGQDYPSEIRTIQRYVNNL